MGFNLYTKKVFGLGERIKTFGLKDKANYTGWARG